MGNFLIYLVVGTLALLVFMRIYTWMTPHDEWEQIRAGNMASAITLGGAILGFTIPIAGSVRVSISIGEFVLWAGFSGLVQCLVFWGCTLIFKKTHAEENRAAATFFLFCSVAFGLLNSAALTP